MFTGVSTASLFLRRNTEDAFPVFQKFGIKNAEVFLTTFSEYLEPFARKLEKVKGDVKLHSFHI